MEPIKLIITLTPDPAREEYSRLSLQVESETSVYYDTVINALIAILDQVVTEKQKHVNEKNLQLEHSTSTDSEEGK